MTILNRQKSTHSRSPPSEPPPRRGQYSIVTENNGSKETEAHIEFMTLAIQQATLARPISTAFNVGVILASGAKIISTGYSRESHSKHAVESAISKSRSAIYSQLVAGSTLYITMEPCSNDPVFSRGKNAALTCTECIIAARVARVVVGVKEPTSFRCHTVDQLLDAGIDVVYLKIMEEECLSSNIHLLS